MNRQRFGGAFGSLAFLAMMLLFIASVGSAAQPATGSMVIATYAAAPQQLDWALSLAESVRQFGGPSSATPIRIYLSPSVRLIEGRDERARAAQVETRVSETPRSMAAYKGGGICSAAALAETEAQGQAEFLVWMDSDTIVLNDLSALALPLEVSLGCTPVFLQRVGSMQAEPLDLYWQTLYETLGVPTASVFPVQSLIDDRTLRAYVNTGLLVVRPGRGILQAWSAAFETLCGTKRVVELVRQDFDKRALFHQAVFSAMICRDLKRGEIKLYGAGINYPLSLQHLIPDPKRPKRLDDVVTCRHDMFFRRPGWEKELRASDELKSWMKARF